MKTIFIYFSLFVFTNWLYGQDPSCLQNGNFSTACTNVNTISGICPTWTNDCGAGWIRSHGSPQMIPYRIIVAGHEVTGFHAYMWSVNVQDVRGEGMFTPYNFITNNSYDLKFRINTSTNGNATGSVKFYAVNNLTQSPLTACGNLVPDNAQKQLIGEYNGLSNGWVNISFLFIPTANYSQIWIYPSATLNTTGYQFNLGVMNVQICPSCDGTIVYNTGPAQSGVTKAGNIYAGSTAGSGGSGTVTIQSNPLAPNTEFIASQEVILLPEFHATICSYCSFSVKVLPCVTLISGSAYDSADVTLYSATESNESDGSGEKTIMGFDLKNEQNLSMDQIKIIPNPSKGNFIIQIRNKLDGIFGIQIFDCVGRLVKKNQVMLTNGSIRVELLNYKTGYYIIKLTKGNFIETRKVFIL